jgi:putative phosphoesterase
MKFLVITDLHQKHSAIEWINKEIEQYKVDFVLHLGDVTDLGTNEDAVELLSEIKAKVYVIPGNCDPRTMPQAIKDVAVDMHGKKVTIDGQDIVALGGGNISPFQSPFELEDDEIYAALKANATEGMILMTHAPSYGVNDEVAPDVHVGCPAIRKIVEEYHPILALSGHIHEAIGCKVIDGTTFVNPGPAKDGYSAVITVDGKKVDVQMLHQETSWF